MTTVVDTNVILVANRQHADVNEQCVLACARRLQELMARGRVAIDDQHLILREYQRKTSPHLGKRPGDAFLKWLLQNSANAARCDVVPLVAHARRGFESFPDDARLSNFDPPDRKFVAVARAHPQRPPIAQAADSKWLGWAAALDAHGVQVEFLCPQEIRRFARQKKGRKDKRR